MGLPTLHARGTFITQFESGFGAWNQLVPDGAVIGSSVPTLQTPVSVTTGGTDAKVLYAGGAPGLVNGLVVVTAEIPGVTRYFSSITAATDEIKNIPGCLPVFIFVLPPTMGKRWA